MRIKTSTESGFTLVELSIATGFLSTLLVLLALITVNVISVYRKGMSIKSINSTGSELIERFTTDITSSPARDLGSTCAQWLYNTTDASGNQNQEAYERCLQDNGYKYVYNQRTATVTIDGKPERDVPVSGSFCTGLYSYIWNTGYLFNNEKYTTDANPAVFIYNHNGVSSVKENFRLLRVMDPSNLVCASQVSSNYDYILSDQFNTTRYNERSYTLPSEPTELLTNEDNTLALFDFVAFTPSQDDTSKQSYYPISFVLATTRGDVNVKATGDYCLAPTGIDTDFYYCAINKFNFAARAIGGQNNANAE